MEYSIDNKYYTWVDVDVSLNKELYRGKGKPEYLDYVHVYWDGLCCDILEGYELKCLNWLKSILGCVVDVNKRVITLHSVNDLTCRYLPIKLDVVSQVSRSIKPLKSYSMQYKNTKCEIYSLYDFSGGKSFLCAISLATYLTKVKGEKVLLVDSGFFSQRLSNIYSRDINNSVISYSDLIYLVHSDTSKEFNISVDICVNELATQYLHGIYMLPCYRYFNPDNRLKIGVEDLSCNIYSVLRDIAYGLNVDTIVIDYASELCFSDQLLNDCKVNTEINKIFISDSSEFNIDLLKHVLCKCLSVQPVGSYKCEFSIVYLEPFPVRSKFISNSMVSRCSLPYDTELMHLCADWGKLVDTLDKLDWVNKFGEFINLYNLRV